MRDDFEIGLSDLDQEGDNSTESEPSVSVGEESGGSTSTRISVKRFKVCEERFREYIPCLDNEDEIKRLVSTERGERFERHCPKEGERLNCLVPAPKGYKSPIPWPKSRDEVCSPLILQANKLYMQVQASIDLIQHTVSWENKLSIIHVGYFYKSDC